MQQLEQHKDTVRVRRYTKGLSITARDYGGYVVDSVNVFQGNMVRVSTDIIVNASWYNISKFNKVLGVTNAK